MRIKRRVQNGFTLIEMLIALVIVSISFSAVIFAINESARTLLRLQERIAANWVAEEVLTRAQLGLLKANTGSQNILGHDWRWDLQIKSTGNDYVQALDINVYNQAQQKVLTITGYSGVPRAK
jgi:general secretion pathway protein I